jgi:uncharacterized protein (TIGR03437 family)
MLAPYYVNCVSPFSPKVSAIGRLMTAWGLAAGFASAALISIPDRSANAGQLIASAVNFSGEGSQVSSVQFDLEWDDGLDLQIAAGLELLSSGKLIYSTAIAPRRTRVLIAGVNQTGIADGELARLFIAVKSGPVFAQVKLNNLVAVTAQGEPVSIRAADATIHIDPNSSGAPLLFESVLNGASLLPGPIAPGEIVTLLGAFGITVDSAQSVVATFNRTPGTVLYALGNQINAVVPFGLDATKAADLEVRGSNRQLAQITLPTTLASPALFTQSGTGLGPGAILNQDYSLNSPTNPAPVGSIVMLYGTGFGTLVPPADAGQPGVLSATTLPVTVKIAGIPAEVTYSGAAPGLPGGLIQTNIRIPNGVGSGDALAVSVSSGSFIGPEGVSISVK